MKIFCMCTKEYIFYRKCRFSSTDLLVVMRASQVALVVNNPPASATDIRDAGMQPPPVFLPGGSPWTEEPGGLQSMGLQTVGRDWGNLAHLTPGAKGILVRENWRKRSFCLQSQAQNSSGEVLVCKLISQTLNSFEFHWIVTLILLYNGYTWGLEIKCISCDLTVHLCFWL